MVSQKKTKKRKTLRNKSTCSPINKKNTFSCFTKSALIKIIDSWNKHNPEQPIKYNTNSTVRILWNKLDKKFKDRCNNEACWIKQPEVKSLKDEEISDTFRPKMPEKWKKNKNEWLTTIDIQNVLKQYQKHHRDFIFIGAVPIDFDKKVGFGQCVINEICNINLEKIYKKGKRKLGFVFNLDPHDKPGSHWVALYCDLNIEKIMFFDSYGSNPPNEVMKLMIRLKEQSKNIGKDMELIVNKTRHQYKNSECGVYCIYFITKLVENNDFNAILNNKIIDEKMEKHRKYYFVKI